MRPFKTMTLADAVSAAGQARDERRVHTAGPWVVHIYPSGLMPAQRTLAIRSPDGFTRAEAVIVQSYGVNDAEAVCVLEANARLIAASPALLEACEAALSYPDIRDAHPALAEQLRAALALARGEDR